jgi:hypothetical protein
MAISLLAVVSNACCRDFRLLEIGHEKFAIRDSFTGPIGTADRLRAITSDRHNRGPGKYVSRHGYQSAPSFPPETEHTLELKEIFYRTCISRNGQMPDSGAPSAK